LVATIPPRRLETSTARRKRVLCVFHCAPALRGGSGAPSASKMTALALQGSSRIKAHDDDEESGLGNGADAAAVSAAAMAPVFSFGADRKDKRKDRALREKVRVVKTRRDEKMKTAWRATVDRSRRMAGTKENQRAVTTVVCGASLFRIALAKKKQKEAEASTAAARLELSSQKKKTAKAKRKEKWMKMKGWWEAAGAAAGAAAARLEQGKDRWLRARLGGLMCFKRDKIRRDMIKKHQTRTMADFQKADFQKKNDYGYCGSLGPECPYNPLLAESVMGMMSDMGMQEPLMTKRTMKRSTEIEEKEGGRFWWLP